MPGNSLPAAVELVRFLPETILVLLGTLIMVLEAVTGDRPKTFLGHLAAAGLGLAACAAVYAHSSPGEAFSGMLVVDGFTTFFRLLVYAVGILTVLSSCQFLTRERANTGEFYALVVFSVAGQSVMVASHELIMIFIGLEISSIATYVLAGFLRDDPRATESAVKYFLLGSFATAFVLYGIAWIYGATGSTELTAIRAAVDTQAGREGAMLAAVAAALMFVGLGFKVSGAPFQMWAPDVYQGAPSPVSAFLSAGPKAAAFAVFLRVFETAFGSIGPLWEPLFWISALLSMTIGNFAALVQGNVKRMLAYSSIAHAGYILVALTARSEVGTAAVMFYLAAYALMNVGAFALLGHLTRKGERFQKVEDLAGLGSAQPLAAALFSIFLLSLIGVPLTAGFFGKFYIFKAALDSGLVWLTVLGLLNSAVGAYYYLRVLVVMYMREASEEVPPVEALSGGLRAALLACSAGTLALGIFPGPVLDFVNRSATLIR
ncbi:MAG: NADH-quinone oxidoreductase subunit N [Bryobacterales bacterium]|nr:NADH-quinone oxidoreductase subunit N [Bryobacterales bacterium]